MKSDRSTFDASLDDLLEEATMIHTAVTEELAERKAAGESGTRVDELEAFNAAVSKLISASEMIPETEDETLEEEEEEDGSD